MGQYSTWQCVELLLSHLPLLNVVFTLLFGAFKKALAAAGGSSSSTRLTLGAGGAPIKTRSERDDQIVQQLMHSMSEKISSPHAKPTTDEEPNEERGKRSPSTSSTVSSSGVVAAEYVICTDEELTSGK